MNVHFDLIFALPEILLAIMICVIIMAGLLATRSRNLAYALSQLTLIGVIAAVLYSHHIVPNHGTFIFHHAFIFDNLAVVLKTLICGIVLLVFVFSRHYNQERKMPDLEFYVLGLIATLGMLVLVSGHDLISIFLGIELISLPNYAMIALHREKSRCIEAAMKYFILGTIASGILLYGFSILFGLTHSLDISHLNQALSVLSTPNQIIATFAVVFVVASIAFKFGAVPFHIWVPDVYDGAPSSITLFISTAPKIAAFGLLVRLLMNAMPELNIQWQPILLVIGLLSVILGNLVAIIQSNIKRMLAYSSIAHMGYMLLGIASGTAAGNAAALFYIISYALMTIGAFGMVILMSHAGYEANRINDFAGLNSRNSWLAFLLMMIMFSLAGVPPFIGFIAKLGIFEALIAAHLTWVAVLAILFAIIGSYYYIRVIKVMYFEEPRELIAIPTHWDVVAAMSLVSFAVLIIGIFPDSLFTLCHVLF